MRSRPTTADLQAALLRLDQLIGAAVERANAVYGPEVARDSFRGLYVSNEGFERLLAQPPGEPLLWSELEAGAVAGFDLDAFDLDVLLIAAAPELDLKYEKLFGYLQDDVTRKRPTVDLVLHLLCPDAESRIVRRAHFAPDAPLLERGLLRLVADPSQTEPPLLAHYLRPEEQVIAYLTGQVNLDRRLAGFCKLSEPATTWDDTVLDGAAAKALVRIAKKSTGRLFFEGPRGGGQAEAAEALARELKVPLLAADLDRAAESNADLESLLPVLFREARFRDAILFIDGSDALPRRLFDSLMSGRQRMTILSGPRTWGHWFPVGFHNPGLESSRRVWERAGVSAEIAADLSARLKLTPAQIHQTVRTARSHALWRGIAKPVSLDYMSAARLHAGQELATLARKVEARHGWDDIVLPPDTAAQLREMCQRVNHRRKVLEEWGFEKKLSMGKGVNALFSGPSGSGKTMGAEVMATQLELDAYKIDLSGVVSKYIGETEKNLDRIFAAAENANAILFFDEADALFGKRSEVRDSHDRYANIEISYLLQKMEEYSGVAILATNLRQNLDDAFIRRLTFSVHFPFPDEASRVRIWHGIWPSSVPIAEGVDCEMFARKFKLSGGNIRNIALAAAFLAVEEGTPVTMDHLLHATRREYQKFGKQMQPGEMLVDGVQRMAS